MCLITSQLEPIITKEDIISYKIMYSDGWSQFRNKKYDFDVLYKVAIKCIEDGCGIQFYYYGERREWFPEVTFKNIEQKVSEGHIRAISLGFHSCSNIELLRELRNWYLSEKIFKCTIPKGSELYEGKLGLIVSNQIIVHNITV